MAGLSFKETLSQSGAACGGLVTPLPKVGNRFGLKIFKILFIPDLVLLKIDATPLLHLLLSLCVKVAGCSRGNECIHTSVAGHDEIAVPASGWSSLE
jgi:hypothetical protein